MADEKNAVGDDPEFKSIADRHGRQFRTVGDMVHGAIRESILTGVFAPGEHLRQDRLAEALGVSRIPVRSALMQLESEGLITLHPFRGAVVNSITADEMREIYEIRSVLETHALRKVLSSMTPERLKRLRKLAKELNDIEDAEAFLGGRLDFYHELYDGDRHPYLVGLIDKLRTESGRYWLQHKIDYASRPGQRDYQHLLEIIEGGDIEGAVEWQRTHLEEVCGQLLELMEEDDRGEE
jgi:DNA-binding GntR family transcriptional regulator